MRLLSILAVSFAIGGSALAQEARMTKFGTHFKPIDAVLNKSHKRVEITGAPSQTAPRYYRLRIRVTNPQSGKWSIVVRSSGGQVLSAFDQEARICETDGGCWTKRLDAKLPAVQLSTVSDDVRVEVVDALYMPSEAETPFYSPMPGNTNELLSSLGIPDSDARIALQMQADNLGMLIGFGPGTDGKPVNWCCSGTRLTSDLFMTNWHCGAAEKMPETSFWQDDICASTIIDMSWDGDSQGREFACRKVEFSDKSLDVAIIRMSGLADGPALSEPLVRPKLSWERPSNGNSVAILHHPACQAKSITRGCSVLNAEVAVWTGPEDGDPKTDFSHNCTTETGSSGGPVYSSEGKIVGIHHLGVSPARMEPGNFGVSAEAILSEIQQSNQALFDELGVPPRP